MGSRVTVWGMRVCLALLALELSVLAVAGNVLVMTVTLGAVGAVVAAIYLKVRQLDYSRRPRLGGFRRDRRRGRGARPDFVAQGAARLRTATARSGRDGGSMLEKARVDSPLQGSRAARGGGVMERTRAQDPPHCNPWRGSPLVLSS